MLLAGGLVGVVSLHGTLIVLAAGCAAVAVGEVVRPRPGGRAAAARGLGPAWAGSG